MTCPRCGLLYLIHMDGTWFSCSNGHWWRVHTPRS